MIKTWMLPMWTILAAGACAQACTAGSDDDQSPVGCDEVCSVSNGANSAAAQTYWRVPQISCGQATCFVKVAFFADGNGRMVSGTNNCLNSSTPNVTTFTWTKTGSNTMLFADTTLTCSPESKTTAGVDLASFTSIDGSVAAGSFKAKFNGKTAIEATLESGSVQ